MQCIQVPQLRLGLLGCRIQSSFSSPYTASSRKPAQLTRPLFLLPLALSPRPFSTTLSATRARYASTASSPLSPTTLTPGSTTSSTPTTITTTTLPATNISNPGSTTSSPSTTTTTITPPTISSTPPTPTTPLTWNTFLHLRRIRRRYNLLSSFVTSTLSLTLSTTLLASQNLDVLSKTLFGLDPFIVVGIWTSAFLAAGWLIGPLVGSTVFKLVYRGKLGGKAGVAELRSKERDFFERIRKNRVDPASSSMQNPVPDYYGEKIVSVQGYRAWLKDQRAFNKKRRSFV